MGRPRTWPSAVLPEGHGRAVALELGRKATFGRGEVTCAPGQRRGCAELAGGARSAPLTARCPCSGRWAPLPSQDQPITPRPCPLKMDRVPCSGAPSGRSSGRRLRNRARDLQVKCVSLVSFLGFGTHIPPFLLPAFRHRKAGPSLSGRKGASLGQTSAGTEGEAPHTVSSLAGWSWRELGRAPLRGRRH